MKANLKDELKIVQDMIVDEPIDYMKIQRNIYRGANMRRKNIPLPTRAPRNPNTGFFENPENKQQAFKSAIFESIKRNKNAMEQQLIQMNEINL